MIEETAQVVRVDGADVWVETRRRSTCSGCAAEKGCGTAALSKVLGNRRTLVRVLADMPLRVGDQVVIGIAEQALVRGSLAVYAVPLLLLLLGAVIGDMGAGRGLWDNGEAGSLVLREALWRAAAIDAAAIHWSAPARSEVDAVIEVVEGRADATFGLATLASQYRLDFVAVIDERYDILVQRQAWFEPTWQSLVEFCRLPEFSRHAAELAGYDVDGQFRVHFNTRV